MEEILERVKQVVTAYNPAQAGSRLKTMRLLLSAIGACRKFINVNSQEDKGCSQRIARELDEVLTGLPDLQQFVSDKEAADNRHTKRQADDHIDEIQKHLRTIVEEEESGKKNLMQDWVKAHPVFANLKEVSIGALPKTAYVLLFQAASGGKTELVTRKSQEGMIISRFRPRQFADDMQIFKAYSRRTPIVGAAVIAQNDLIAVVGKVPEPREKMDQLQVLLAESKEAIGRPAREFVDQNVVLKELHDLARRRKLPKDAYILLFQEVGGLPAARVDSRVHKQGHGKTAQIKASVEDESKTLADMGNNTPQSLDSSAPEDEGSSTASVADASSPAGDANDESNTVDDSSAPGHDDSSAPGHDDSSAPGHDDSSAPGHDDSSAPGHDDSSAPGDDDSSAPGDDDSSAAGDDDSSTLGDDDSQTSADDDSDTVGDDDSTSEDDDSSSLPVEQDSNAPAEQPVEPVKKSNAELEIVVRTTEDGRIVSRFWSADFAIRHKLFDNWRGKAVLVGASIIRRNELLRTIGELPQPKDGQSQIDVLLQRSRNAVEKPSLDFVAGNEVLKGLHELANKNDFGLRDANVVLFTQPDGGSIQILSASNPNWPNQPRIPLTEFQFAKSVHDKFSALPNIIGASVIGEGAQPPAKRPGPATDKNKFDATKRRDTAAGVKLVIVAAFGRTPLKVSHLATPENFRRLGLDL